MRTGVIQWVQNQWLNVAHHSVGKGSAQSFVGADTKSAHEIAVLWAPVWIGAGIGAYFELSAEPNGWHGAALFVMAFGLYVISRKPVIARKIAASLLLITLGFAVAQFRSHWVQAPILQNTLEFQDVVGVIDQLELRDNGIRITLFQPMLQGVDPANTPQRVRVLLKKTDTELRPGDLVRLRATLHPPPGAVMPGAHDFARDYYFDRIGGVGFSTSAVEVINAAERSRISEGIAKIRQDISASLISQLPPGNGQVAAALLVGEMGAVPEDINDAMRDSGLAHVLSISGLHLSIAAGLMFVGMRWLLVALAPGFSQRWNSKKIAAGFALLSSLAYLLLAGTPVPAVRSFVMVAFVLIAAMFDRKGISVNSLAWAAIALLIAEPECLLSVSFQMSFAATLGMLVMAERYGGLLQHTHRGYISKLTSYLLAIAMTSLVATVATAPFIIQAFQRLTVWGILSNMAVIPLASFLIMPAGVAYLLLYPLGVSWIAIKPLSWGISFMLDVANWAATLPHAVVTVPPMTHWGFLLVVAGGFMIALRQSGWKIPAFMAIIAGLMTILLYQNREIYISDDGKNVAIVEAQQGAREMIFLRGRGASFTAQNWLRAEAIAQALPMKEAQELLGDRLQCAREFCIYRAPGGLAIAVAKRPEAAEAMCEDSTVDILITDAAAPVCAATLDVIDANRLHRDGALSGWILPHQLRLESVAQERGQRLWTQ